MHHNYHMDPPDWIQGEEEMILTAGKASFTECIKKGLHELLIT